MYYQTLIRGWLFAWVGAIALLSAWPIPVHAAAAFFFRAPGTYNQLYYYNRTPNPNYYQRTYSPANDPRVYMDPRSNAQILNSQGAGPDVKQDYYQQYQNWWQKT